MLHNWAGYTQGQALQHSLNVNGSQCEGRWWGLRPDKNQHCADGTIKSTSDILPGPLQLSERFHATIVFPHVGASVDGIQVQGFLVGKPWLKQYIPQNSFPYRLVSIKAFSHSSFERKSWWATMFSEWNPFHQCSNSSSKSFEPVQYKALDLFWMDSRID